ncbi:family S53 protease-like protein [Mycena latifolia]|nr:family S53 protease-like protein [Mycena latifolia]
MTLGKLLAILSIVASASAGSMVVHQSRSAAPAGFINQGLAPPNQMLTLRVALASTNISGLQERLMSLSTPGSSEFRQWLSMDDVKSFVQPSAETVSAFQAFAAANGLTPTVISPNGDWMSITLPVVQANKLFATQFEVFAHPSMTNTITRTLSVSLPSELVGHVAVIHPTTTFVAPNSRLANEASNLEKRQTAASSCNTADGSGVINPSCLQQLYGIPTTPATQKTNALLVTAYQDEFAQSADLTNFLQQFRPDINSTETFTLLSADNGTNPQGPNEAGLEANLDVEYAAGLATEVPLQFLSVGGDDFVQGLLDTTTFLDGVANPPSVITTSYGGTESAFDISMATKICDGYMALGARGISVIFASGDGGVRGGHDSPDQCADNTFLAVFPASCPFLTSVGSTAGFAPEIAANFSGGGFSNFFAAQEYQTAAVSNFLATVPSDFAGIFNKTGRGYPDVSVQGVNFEIVGDGQTVVGSGTSASSPSFAAVIALINDRLVASGKPVLGFLNPFLYSQASTAFNDVTVGHNVGSTCPQSSVGVQLALFRPPYDHNYLGGFQRCGRVGSFK